MTSTATQSKGSPSARFRSQVDIETHGMHACGMGGNAQMHAYTFTRIYTLFWENSTRGQKVVRRLYAMEDKETNKWHLTANEFHSIETKQGKLTTTSSAVTEHSENNFPSPPQTSPRTDAHACRFVTLRAHRESKGVGAPRATCYGTSSTQSGTFASARITALKVAVRSRAILLVVDLEDLFRGKTLRRRLGGTLGLCDVAQREEQRHVVTVEHT